MVHTKIHVPSPGCPQPTIALQCRFVSESTPQLFIHCYIATQLLFLVVYFPLDEYLWWDKGTSEEHLIILVTLRRKMPYHEECLET